MKRRTFLQLLAAVLPVGLTAKGCNLQPVPAAVTLTNPTMTAAEFDQVMAGAVERMFTRANEADYLNRAWMFEVKKCLDGKDAADASIRI